LDHRLSKVLRSRMESADTEFKNNLNPESKRNWVELIKDIVAIANSGGGVILFGVNNSGEPNGEDVSQILNLDPADITDKIFSYTSNHFSEIEIAEIGKGANQLAAFIISGSKIPMIFTRPGTYATSARKQARAFSVGTLYFRHGAKSEPGTQDDIIQSIERRLEDIRDQWLSGVRRVFQAPEGSQFAVIPPEVRQSSSPNAMPIRIVNDPSAPEYRIINPNTTHPHRTADLLDVLGNQLPNYSLNFYDILAVRRAYEVDEQGRFFYRPMSGSPQYSDDFVNWIIEKCEEDPDFFADARERYKEIRYH
jgi:hypothetical protein